MRPMLIATLFTTVVAGCGSPSDPPVTLAASSLQQKDDTLFAPRAHPYGLSMETWSEIFWDWLYAIPADRNPMLDTTGADCGVAQFGPVWFLPTVIDPGGLASFTRTCTVPHGRALLFNLSGVLNDYPCPDPTFKPAPGQSLYDFLAAGAKPIVDSVNLLTLAVDGGAPQSMLDRRYTSDDLFYVDGSTTLQSSLDGCITGTPQPAIWDGFFAMVEPLSRGAHTLVAHATDTHGTDVTLTYLLTIQ